MHAKSILKRNGLALGRETIISDLGNKGRRRFMEQAVAGNWQKTLIAG